MCDVLSADNTVPIVEVWCRIAQKASVGQNWSDSNQCGHRGGVTFMAAVTKKQLVSIFLYLQNRAWSHLVELSILNLYLKMVRTVIQCDANTSKVLLDHLETEIFMFTDGVLLLFNALSKLEFSDRTQRANENLCVSEDQTFVVSVVWFLFTKPSLLRLLWRFCLL